MHPTQPEELGFLLLQFRGGTKALPAGEPLLRFPGLCSVGTQLLTHRHLLMTEGPGFIQDVCKCLQALVENL